ncbi:MAG: DUF1552 domain-containing protein, partial [Nannocystaceae bacterium]|nr:DUF1552 domain-containing protein [Nannocystaceae bacterium]
MRHTKIRRRTLIQGLGASTLAAAPFLSRMAHAEDGAPKRLVILATGQNSLQKELWGLDGLTSGADLPAQVSPANAHLPLEGLQDYRDRLNVLLQLDAMPGNSGHRNSPQMLTGVQAKVSDIYSAGISIDAHISQALLGRPPMALGALAGRPPVDEQSYLSYAGGGLPIVPEDNPMDAFDKYLFSVDPDDPAEVRLAGRRQSVRDLVRGDLQRLRSHVSKEDFERVQRHLEGLDAIEDRLSGGLNCSPEPPVPPAGYDPMSAQHYPETMRMQIDIAAAALACDAHRVVTLQFGKNGPNYIYPTWPEHGINYSFNEHRAAPVSYTHLTLPT